MPAFFTQTIRAGGLRGRLVRGAMGTGLIKAANAGLSLVVGILLARLLGPEGYGLYAFAFSLVTLLALPAQAGLPALLVREVAGYRFEQRWDLLRGLLSRSAQAIVGLSCLTALGAGMVAWMLADWFDVIEAGTLTMALLLLPLTALGSFIGATLRGLSMTLAGQFPEQVLRPALLTLSIVALYHWGVESPAVAMGAHAFAALLALVASILVLGKALPLQARGVEPRFDSRSWMRSVLPLSFLTGMQWIISQTDILMLGFLTSGSEVGIYRVAVQASGLVAFTLTAINIVLAPNISKLFAAGDWLRLQRMITQSARVIMATALPVAGAFIISGRPLLEFFFGVAFNPGYPSLVILCVGQLINAGAGSVGLILNMTGNEGETARVVAFAAAANVVLNLLLIPLFGMEGAAAATTATLAVKNVFLCRKVWRRLGIRSTAFAFSSPK